MTKEQAAKLLLCVENVLSHSEWDNPDEFADIMVTRKAMERLVEVVNEVINAP